MGNTKNKYLNLQRKQRIATRENKAYYQNDSDWKNPSSEREIRDRRTEPKTE